MTSYTAIADVGTAVTELLQDRLSDLLDPSNVVLGDPTSVGTGNSSCLTLYLYQIQENAQLSNDNASQFGLPVSDEERVGQRPTKGPAVVLDLHYLLTAHPANGGGDETTRASEQHSLLGRAMQVLHDEAVLESVGRDEADDTFVVRLTPAAVSFNDLLSLWGTFTELPYRPSVAYVATPVVIESQTEADARPVNTIERQYVVRDGRQGIRGKGSESSETRRRTDRTSLGSTDADES